jgi:outer membrane protein OmpA-like peptidoglycan-associated protein/tetratricopeptide (TPR) repeat protein
MKAISNAHKTLNSISMKLKLSRLLVFSLIFSGCASYHVRQGNRQFDDLAYSSAIEEYQKALSKKEFPNARLKLAECYRKINDIPRAEEAFAKAVQLPQAQPIHKLHYGQILMKSAKYEQAKIYFDQYLKAVPTDTDAIRLRKSCDSISIWMADSIKYTIKSTNLNSGQSNFSPVWYKDGVVFTSDRNIKKKTYDWTGRPFLELYYAKGTVEKGFASPTSLTGDVNGLYHDGPATFSSKGDTIYFSRNNYENRKIAESSRQELNLKICQAVRKDTSFKNITEFKFNSKEYSTAHPSLSKDGNIMYFVSDMPGGMGGTDIYMTQKVNGEWSKPVNLGGNINTPYNEMFPYIWQDSILYFSSEGHYNFGGLDIFKSTKMGNSWSPARNAGYPLNSSYDDFGVVVTDTGTSGLFSSNRNNKFTTLDNIYSFELNDLRFNLEGMAVEKATQFPLEGVKVELLNKDKNTVESVFTGPDGKFKFKLNEETDFSVVGSKDTYFTNTEDVSTKGKKQSEDMFVKLKLELERIVINKPIVLENIYYDLDKYDIRPDAAQGLDNLIAIMKDNPGINIELSSHTDSRADDRYNDILSQKRADAAVDYIIAHGISGSRLVAKGYGERQLVNRCANNVKCTEEEHQQNRRTEFKVTSMQVMNQ